MYSPRGYVHSYMKCVGGGALRPHGYQRIIAPSSSQQLSTYIQPSTRVSALVGPPRYTNTIVACIRRKHSKKEKHIIVFFLSVDNKHASQGTIKGA